MVSRRLRTKYASRPPMTPGAYLQQAMDHTDRAYNAMQAALGRLTLVLDEMDLRDYPRMEMGPARSAMNRAHTLQEKIGDLYNILLDLEV